MLIIKSDFISKFQLLWPAGIIIILYVFLSSISTNESIEFIYFFCLGTIVPVIILIIYYFLNIHEKISKLLFSILSYIYIISIMLILHKFKNNLIIIILVSLITTFLFYSENNNKKNINKTNLILIFLTNIFCWTISATLVHWDSIRIFLKNQYIFILFLSVLFLSSEIFFKHKNVVTNFKITKFDWLALICFFCLSFRTDSLFIGDSWTHWAYFIGVVDAVKQGGYLLWDVPSQYGFLLILITAILPFKDSWQSFFVLQGVLLFIISIPFYLLTKYQFKSIFSGIWTFIIVFSSLYFSTNNSISPTCIPSGSVIRFFWVYVLLFYFWLDFILINKVSKFYNALGIIIWLAGSMWSAESAIYCSSIFIPAFLYRLYLESNNVGINSNLLLIFNNLFILFCYMAVLILIISIFYYIKIDHLPDYLSFYEYIIAYSAGGIGGLPIEKLSPVWVLITIYSIILSIISIILLSNNKSRSLPLLLSIFFGFWSISSYFVGRSHPWNITVLIPEISIILIIIYNIIYYENALQSYGIINFYNLFVVAFFSIVIISNTIIKTDFLSFIQTKKTFNEDIILKLPVLDSNLNDLLIQSHISEADLIVFDNAGDDQIPFISLWTNNNNIKIFNCLSWLPKPLSMLDALTDERKLIYFERMSSRFKNGGWLIQKKNNGKYIGILNEFINKHYIRSLIYENEYWLIIKIDPKYNYDNIN